MNYKSVIIDGNSLLNRAYYAIPPLNNHEGKNVNAVFGFINILLKALTEIRPTHLAVAFDKKGKNFRHQLYADYKATRKGMPDDLAQQMPVLFDLLGKMGIKRVEQGGVEADDVIGTLSKKCDFPTVIVSGDRDLLQLVDENTVVLLTKRGITEVEEVNSGNIKTLYGMTPQQIVEYKALKGDASDNIPGVMGIGDKTAMSLLDKYGTVENVYAHIGEIKGSVGAKLLAGKDMAFLSKTLATIKTDVDVDCCLDDMVFRPIPASVKDDFEKLEFRSLFKKLAELSDNAEEITYIEENVRDTPVTCAEELARAVEKLSASELVGVYYLDNLYLSGDKDSQYVVTCGEGFTFSDAAEIMRPLMEGGTAKAVYDGKELRHRFDNAGVSVNNIVYDVAIMQYLVEYRAYKSYPQLKQAYNLKSESAALLTLAEILRGKLEENSTLRLYEEIELPLSLLLFEMERSGFKVDVAVMEELGAKYKKEMEELTAEAYRLAGEKFNILSPKQLGAVLFEKLGLPAGKKTKTGYSTENEVLEKLSGAHPIVNVVRSIRKISKLLGTYIEGFRPLITADHMIHTTFNQTLTSTGRLSSSEPNLQNLPVREDDGKEIRKMFIPTLDTLVSADYSQIELRLLAHFSGDENLIAAFNNHQDIHSMVAQEIFDIPQELVTPNMRRMAKAVNFGIIYGISEYGLAQNLGTSAAQAKQYIARYFNGYPKIRQYLQSSVDFAKQHGYVVTVTGRRRQIPEISSSNYQLRTFGERAAMNMPLQGSAADIIKVAMINVARELKARGMTSKIILQIHDELVLDVKKEEEEEVKRILQEQMSDCFDLKVKMEINISSGKNLYEAK